MTLSHVTLGMFLLFCLIGACLMVMPGFSSPRLPVRARLFASLGVTLALAPALLDRTVALAMQASDVEIVLLILRESVVGGVIGLLGRALFAALETMCVAAAMATGFGNAFGARVDEGESMPELASLVMFAAVTLFFITDGHAEVVRALADSYAAIPPGEAWDARLGLARFTDALARAFPLALRITSPFLLYGIVVNFAFGLLNRLVPNIPVFFISTPFVIAGGLLVFYAIVGALLALFTDGVHAWLVKG